MKKIGNAALSWNHFLLLLKKTCGAFEICNCSYMNTPILLCLPDSFSVLIEKPK